MSKVKRNEALVKTIKGFVEEKDDVKVKINYADDVIKKKRNQKQEAIY